ncbi:hypothetical protein [Bowmanella denitrificans]|uniref:hypothetical protein n=1 Tax=Bowmanella denitrificans TaxID=366582 RepID=UPI000C9C7C21|nr:hypothetical protein [Bowmanella denitrificans]
MPYSIAAKNEAANGVAVNLLKLHSGDPGAAGTTNAIAGASSACVYGAAANGVRDLDEELLITVPAGAQVSHYSVWQDTAFKGAFAFNNSETYTNAGTARIPSAPITASDAA